MLLNIKEQGYEVKTEVEIRERSKGQNSNEQDSSEYWSMFLNNRHQNGYTKDSDMYSQYLN